MPAEQLLFGVFHQPHGGLVDEREAALQIAVVDHVARLLDEPAKPQFAALQRFLRLLALGYVAIIDDDAANARVVEPVDADALDAAPRSVVVAQPEGAADGNARPVESTGS